MAAQADLILPPGLGMLRDLEADQYEALRSGLERVRPTAYRLDLGSQLDLESVGITSSGLSAMLDAILPLAVADRTGAETSDGLLAAIVDDVVPEGDAFESSRETLRSRIRALIQLDSVRITARSSDVMFGNSHVFRTARIFTDVRPVFRDNADGIPEIGGAVIVHLLRIDYWENEATRAFYVALDTSDVDSMRRVLDRAQQKADSMASLLERAGVEYLRVQSGS
jgi:hypothetical protein